MQESCTVILVISWSLQGVGIVVKQRSDRVAECKRFGGVWWCEISVGRGEQPGVRLRLEAGGDQRMDGTGGFA